MAFYPVAGLQQDSTREGLFKSLKSETEKGYIQTRVQMIPKQLFSLHHKFTYSESNTLEQFFYNNNGTIFNLIYKGITYNVVFISESYKAQPLSRDYCEVTMNLREV